MFLIVLLKNGDSKKFFIIFTAQVSISYHVSFWKTVNNIPAILVLCLDMNFLEPLNAFTKCVNFNGRVKYLTEIISFIWVEPIKP